MGSGFLLRGLRARMVGPLYLLRRWWAARRQTVIYLCVCLAAAFVQLFIAKGPWGELLLYRQMETLFSLRGAEAAPEEVAVIGIDDRTHTRFELPVRAAFPRRLLAEGLERLAALKPRRVVLDFVLHGRLSAEDDEQLAAAIAQSPTVLGRGWEDESRGGAGGVRRRELRALTSDPIFMRAAAGDFSMYLKRDRGAVRRFERDFDRPGFIPTAAGAVFDRLPPPDDLPGRGDFINYYGPAGTVATYSFYSLFDSENPLSEEEVRGRVVYVGLRYDLVPHPDAKDFFLTPFRGGVMYGVEIHAVMGANLLRRDWIRRLPAALEDRALFIATGALVLLMLAARGWWLMASGAAGIAATTAASMMLFNRHMVVNSAGLILMIPAAAFLSVWLLHMERRAKERRERELLDRYHPGGDRSAR